MRRPHPLRDHCADLRRRLAAAQARIARLKAGQPDLIETPSALLLAELQARGELPVASACQLEPELA